MIYRRCLTGILISLLFSGCAVSKAMEDTPGLDVSAITSGVHRHEVENLLGSPHREWQTNAGIRYALYRYDGGNPGSAADASAILFLDLISLGLTEAIMLLDETNLKGPNRAVNMAVAYGPDDRALGVFDDVGEFDDLPENGVAPTDQP